MITLVNSRKELYDKFLPKNCIGAELGVEYGLNAIDLLTLTGANKIYLCDSWPGMDNVYEEAKLNTKSFEQLEIIRIDDHDWLPTLPDKFLDWAYIDTMHTYEQTIIELQLLRTKVKHVIAGHDLCCSALHYNWADQWHSGVLRALLETVAEGWLEPLAIVESTVDSGPQDLYPSWACKVKQ